MHFSVVYKWQARFRSGQDSVEDDPRCGRPSIVMCSFKEPLKDMINRDRRTTVRAIADEHDISVPTVYGIFTDELIKISARWVPRLHKDSEKECRVRCSQEFVTHYEAEGDAFLDSNITTDETWLYYFDSETKRFGKPHVPLHQKRLGSRRAREKKMFVFFMDRHGMLLQHRVSNSHSGILFYFNYQFSLFYGSPKIHKSNIIQTVCAELNSDYIEVLKPFRFTSETYCWWS